MDLADHQKDFCQGEAFVAQLQGRRCGGGHSEGALGVMDESGFLVVFWCFYLSTWNIWSSGMPQSTGDFFWLTFWYSLIIRYPGFKAHTVWLAFGRVARLPDQDKKRKADADEKKLEILEINFGLATPWFWQLGSIILAVFPPPPPGGVGCWQKITTLMRWFLMTWAW